MEIDAALRYKRYTFITFRKTFARYWTLGNRDTDGKGKSQIFLGMLLPVRELRLMKSL
jgi:hypothetical protein